MSLHADREQTSRRWLSGLGLLAGLGLWACASAPPRPLEDALPGPASPSAVTAPVASAPDAPVTSASAVASVAPRALPSLRASAYGPSADLDGDGFSDLLLRLDKGTFSLVPGSRSGPDEARKVELKIAGTRWNFGMAATGDLDGDGLVDLVVGAPLLEGQRGGVAVLRGAAGKLPQGPAASLTIEELPPLSELGAAVAVGDFDGDGYDDLLASAPATSAGASGKVFFFRGSKTGPGSTPTNTLEAPPEAGAGAAFGAALASVGDLDGDGVEDLAIGAYRGDQKRGMVFLYKGSPKGPSSVPWRTLRAPPKVRFFGHGVVRAGDVNGDGRPDLLVTCMPVDTPRAFLYLSGEVVASEAPSQELRAAVVGYHAAAPGDIDGDGRADLLMGDTTRATSGTAFLLRGGEKGYEDRSPVELPNRFRKGGRERFSSYYGYGPSPAGDVNKDGVDDLLVAGHLETFYWPGARGFTPGEPVALEGTTAASPTFSH